MSQYPRPSRPSDARRRLIDTAEPLRTAKNGFSALLGAVLLVAVILTAVSFALAVSVSRWWFIGVAICGGFSLIVSVWLFVIRKFLSNF
jgi:Flp pilus assembly protein TadB